MYSSTSLKGPAETGCWRQLDFSEWDTPSLFPLMYASHLGNAAHAVLQNCIERKADTEDVIRKTAEEVGDLLIAKGRTFRGRHEPPLPADDVWAGVKVAMDYLFARGLPVSPDAETVSVEKQWTHPTLPYRGLIDLVSVYPDGDEEFRFVAIEAADHKTSWQDGESALDTLQRWGQAVLLWRNLGGEVNVIRQRVINLRTWHEYTRDLWLDDEDDVALLEQWERRIAALCKTADQKPRAVAPGVGCITCPWRHACDEALTFGGGDTMDAVETATELAKIEARRHLLITLMKCMEVELPVRINGGYVGFKDQVRRVLSQGKEADILDGWADVAALEIEPEDHPAWVSLLTAFKLGKGNLDAFAKAMYPERAKGIAQVRAEYVESITDELRTARFGVWTG